MKKLLKIFTVTTLLVSLGATTVSANRYITGRHANYKFYKRNGRVTLAISNRENDIPGRVSDDMISEVYKYIPAKYSNTVYNQIMCHGVGAFFEKKAVWNIELQRDLKFDVLEWKNTKCNVNRWIDNDDIDWIVDNSFQPYSISPIAEFLK